MIMTMSRVSVLGLALFLAGCGGDRDPQLMNLRKSSAAPDEFSILPTKPLEQPASYAALPEPTPGGANRVDRNPNAEAVVALGGNPNGGSGGDGALIQTAARYGVSQDIRGVTAQEDLAFRQKNNGRLLERLFNVTTYYKAYDDQSLDQYRELRRLRRAGARTPAAPPDPTDQ